MTSANEKTRRAASPLRPPRLEGAIEVGGRRRLGYAEFGPATGRPLLWFHGTPGARRQISPEARETAGERDVRIIAVERPGIGASTPHLYPALHDFALDIERLGDALALDRFAVAGLSGGGPYALACAHHMPDRVVAAAVLGGVAPAVGPEAAAGGVTPLTRAFSPLLARTSRPLGLSLRVLIRLLTRFQDQAIDAFASFMPPGDKRVFEDPAIREMFVDDILTGSREQMYALVFDAVVFGRHWGFSVRDLRTPVHLWYGDADNIVPVEHGHHLAARIPGAILRIRKEEGHLGGLGAAPEIFDALLEEWERAPRTSDLG